jgi:hypothetical protein
MRVKWTPGSAFSRLGQLGLHRVLDVSTSDASLVLATWKPTTGAAVQACEAARPRPSRRRSRPRRSGAHSRRRRWRWSSRAAARPCCHRSPARAPSARGRRPCTRPPGASTWKLASALFTWAAVRPRAASRSGSTTTLISRATPPTRVTWATPLARLQLTGDVVVDEPGQLLVGHRRRLDGVGDDREQAVDLDAGDLRLVDVARQDLAVWSILARTSSVFFCRSSPMLNWIEVVETPWVTTDWTLSTPVIAGDGVLHRTGDLGLHLAGRRARLGDGDGDDRELDVRVLLNRQARVGDQPGDHQADEQQR